MKLSNHEHLPAWDQMTHSDKVRILAAEYLLGWKWYPASKNSQQCILAPTPEDVDLVRYGEHIASLVPKMDIDTAEAVLKTIGIDEPLEHIDTGAIWRVDGFHDEYKNMCDVFFLTREQAVAYVEKELGECEWFEKHDTCWTARTGPDGVYIDIYKVPLGEKV